MSQASKVPKYPADTETSRGFGKVAHSGVKKDDDSAKLPTDGPEPHPKSEASKAHANPNPTSQRDTWPP